MHVRIQDSTESALATVLTPTIFSKTMHFNSQSLELKVEKIKGRRTSFVCS
jgi:hypothetical protein